MYDEHEKRMKKPCLEDFLIFKDQRDPVERHGSAQRWLIWLEQTG